MTDKPLMIEGMIAGTKTGILFNAACIVDIQNVSPWGEKPSNSTRYSVRYAVGNGEVVTVDTNRWSLQELFSVKFPISETPPE